MRNENMFFISNQQNTNLYLHEYNYMSTWLENFKNL